MSDEEKKDPRRADWRREIFFLPPLKMILSFFDKESRPREDKKQDVQKQEETVGKNVEKLIEKLREKKE